MFGGARSETVMSGGVWFGSWMTVSLEDDWYISIWMMLKFSWKAASVERRFKSTLN